MSHLQTSGWFSSGSAGWDIEAGNLNDTKTIEFLPPQLLVNFNVDVLKLTQSKSSTLVFIQTLFTIVPSFCPPWLVLAFTRCSSFSCSQDCEGGASHQGHTWRMQVAAWTSHQFRASVRIQWQQSASRWARRCVTTAQFASEPSCFYCLCYHGTKGKDNAAKQENITLNIFYFSRLCSVSAYLRTNICLVISE